MKSAIAQLEIYLNTLETNEPINRAAGNYDQANLEANSAVETMQALLILRAGEEAKRLMYPKVPVCEG